MFNFSIIKNFSATKIKFGVGVVGKVNNSIMLLIGVIGGLIFTFVKYGLIKNEWTVLVLILGMLGSFLYYVKNVLTFAERNPDIAVLDGVELVKLKEVGLTARDISDPINSKNITNPDKTKKSIIENASKS